jgi:hypothetical protein
VQKRLPRLKKLTNEKILTSIDLKAVAPSERPARGDARGDFAVEIPPALPDQLLVNYPAPGGAQTKIPRPCQGHTQWFNLLKEMIPS